MKITAAIEGAERMNATGFENSSKSEDVEVNGKRALLDDSSNLLSNLSPIMKRYGVRCSPTEFYEAVNLHFHAAESRVYDDVHQDMWRALPRQFELLTEDCVPIMS